MTKILKNKFLFKFILNKIKELIRVYIFAQIK